ncbi:MAG: VOC family protein [Thermoplasmata archaeon]|jgi:predicted enzyme related to lactoylglutathione lyase|nr:VOC family protein [Thermoplasmata archaeon]
MNASVVHFEIPLDNVERGHKFYRETFGWKVNALPDMDYAMVQTTETDAEGSPKNPGAINGGMAKRQHPLTAPVITIMVDDIASAQKQIEKNGGKIVQKKAPIGDGSMGFTAYFKDTEGNIVGLFQVGKS